MYILDGKRLAPNKAFTTADGRQFPKNWLSLTTLEEKQAIGISVEPDPVASFHDPRFYWSLGVAKDINDLKAEWIANVKSTTGSLLAPTDWYITRQAETGKPVPQIVLDYRAAVRIQSDNREVMINGTADTEQLVAVITSDFGGMFPWPPGPFDPLPVADEVVEEPVSGSDYAVTGSAILGGSGEDVISF